MSIPEQVRKQSEAIAALYEDINREEGGNDGNEEVVAPVEPAAPAAPTPPQNPDTSGQYAQLQAAYARDVGARDAALTEATKKIGQLELMIATLSDVKPTPAPGPVAPVSKLTDQEREEYGESIDIMRKVAEEASAPHLAKIAHLEAIIAGMAPQQAQLKQTVDNVASTVSQNREDKFWNDLTALVPNWKTINADQGFHNWLLSADPLTGMARQTYLDDAQGRLDVQRVANFFTEWSGKSGNVQVSQNQDRKKKELEAQVAPSPSKTKIAGQVEQKKVYTTTDVRDFYADVRSGKYRGREADKTRIEADIFLAQTEGRITG